MDILEKFIHRKFIEQEMEFSELYRYLDKYKNTGMEGLCEVDIKRNEDIELNRTIWLFWNQGLEHAPGLVKKCYESVCRNVPNGFEIVLLSDQNLSKYIRLPDYIWDKYEKGYITTTHLSDMIRIELLYMYGGCWIDATVFCSSIIPMYMLTGKMFVFQLPSVLSVPTVKMSSWWMSAGSGNRLIHLTRQMLYEYWKQETDIRNYFLLHIIMSKLVDEDIECRNIFQKIPYFNSGNAHVLQGKLGEMFGEEEWKMIRDASCIHKLTYKKKYLQGDIYNYYTALLADGLCPIKEFEGNEEKCRKK